MYWIQDKIIAIACIISVAVIAGSVALAVAGPCAPERP